MGTPQVVTLKAPVQFWRTLAEYARWLLDQAETANGYCPRIGAQEAAEAYLQVTRTIRAKRETTLRLDQHSWTWLARGLYEAEQRPPEGRPALARARQASRFLARLLHEQGCWPAYHGLTCVNLSDWGEWGRYADWQEPSPER